MIFGINDKMIDEKLEQMHKTFWSKYDTILNELDPKRTLAKVNDQYIYSVPVPGFSKEDLTVKNHKESKGLTIESTKKDSITGTERKLNHSYTYPKGLALKSVKCLNGLLYIIFENINKSSTAEEVKIED